MEFRKIILMPFSCEETGKFVVETASIDIIINVINFFIRSPLITTNLEKIERKKVIKLTLLVCIYPLLLE